MREDQTLAIAAAAKSLQSCLTLCNPMDSSPSGSSVPGILQARILEWDAFSFSNACMLAKSLQSCPTLCDPTDSSPPGSSVHRILYARVLEWVGYRGDKKQSILVLFRRQSKQNLWLGWMQWLRGYSLFWDLSNLSNAYVVY